MSPLSICVGLLLIVGGVLSLPVKGGEKGADAKSGQWTQPKDWDWSVTTSPTNRVSTGRLIPVSEATDDVPTPGYKMSDLQRVLIVPSIVSVNQVPLMKEFSPNNTQSFSHLEEKENENQSSTPQNPAYSVNEGDALQSLDHSQNISVVKETLSLQTTLPPVTTTQANEAEVGQPDDLIPHLPKQNKNKDDEEPQEEERVPVNEPPMVKVTLPEICSITGLGCRDRPTTVSLDGEQSTASATESGKKDPTNSINQLSEEHGLLTTLGTSETTKRSVDNVFKDSTIYLSNSESNQQTEKVSLEFLPSYSTANSDVQSTEKLEFSSTDKSYKEGTTKIDRIQYPKENSADVHKENIDVQKPESNSQTIIHETAIPQQEQIEEAYIQKVDSFDNLEQHPVNEETPILGQFHVSSSGIDEQKHLDSKFELKPKDSSEEKDESSEEDKHNEEHKLEASSEGKEDSSEEKIVPPKVEGEKNTNRSNAEIKEPTEEEKKLIKMHNFEKENSPNEQPVDDQTESPSISERITGYWRAATGFVSKALNI